MSKVDVKTSWKSTTVDPSISSVKAINVWMTHIFPMKSSDKNLGVYVPKNTTNIADTWSYLNQVEQCWTNMNQIADAECNQLL